MNKSIILCIKGIIMETMMKPIRNLDGDNAFLSNFFPSPFVDSRGVSWDTVEHFFQAMKSTDQSDQEFVRGKMTAGRAKRAGRKIHLRQDWEDIKKSVMRDALTFKFSQNEFLAENLVSTGDAEIIEGNVWHDNFWGACSCNKCKYKEKKNTLGKILMDIRWAIKIKRKMEED